eukprot:Platyproteum_vivax@DN8751_c0_g1_i1.p1
MKTTALEELHITYSSMGTCGYRALADSVSTEKLKSLKKLTCSAPRWDDDSPKGDHVDGTALGQLIMKTTALEELDISSESIERPKKDLKAETNIQTTGEAAMT